MLLWFIMFDPLTNAKSYTVECKLLRISNRQLIGAKIINVREAVWICIVCCHYWQTTATGINLRFEITINTIWKCHRDFIWLPLSLSHINLIARSVQFIVLQDLGDIFILKRIERSVKEYKRNCKKVTIRLLS